MQPISKCIRNDKKQKWAKVYESCVYPLEMLLNSSSTLLERGIKHWFIIVLLLSWELSKIVLAAMFQTTARGIEYIFLTSNNHASDEPHRLSYRHCAKLTKLRNEVGVIEKSSFAIVVLSDYCLTIFQSVVSNIRWISIG